MARVVTVGGRAYIQAMAGLGVLMVVVLGSAAWLGRLLLGWSHRLRRLETALASSTDELPKLEPTGQRDLDRIVDAVNRAGTRLSEARSTAEALMREMAEGKRLASLGRVVAGVAHEIRNPIAAMRLKAENAVAAGPDLARKDGALQAIVAQIERLEALLQNLLSSVQLASPQPMLVKDITSQSTAEQLRLASAAIAHGCDAITAGYQSFASDTTNAPRDLRDPKFRVGLTRVVQTALHDLDGVEGGVWQTDRGSLAYAFPTYEGTGEKTDLPQAEESSIREAAESAALASIRAQR